MHTLLTADEVADRLRLSRRHVYEMARRGELRTVKLGRKILRFFPADLDRYLKEKADENS